MEGLILTNVQYPFSPLSSRWSVDPNLLTNQPKTNNHSQLKVTALIPARYASTRLHAKLIQDLNGFSVIQRTYLSTVQTRLFDEVLVVTDHETIADQIKSIGGKVFFSQKPHESGSDRIAEAAVGLDSDVIINIQGDEPFQNLKSLQQLVSEFEDPKVKVASLKVRISEVEAENPNIVKVVTDLEDDAVYFSRSKIPYYREDNVEKLYLKHIGIYAYRKEILLKFTSWNKTYLEKAEMLEQLRLLEHGIKIRVVETQHQTIAIDTAADLERAHQYLQNHPQAYEISGH